jgi:hypothetical protein
MGSTAFFNYHFPGGNMKKWFFYKINSMEEYNEFKRICSSTRDYKFSDYLDRYTEKYYGKNGYKVGFHIKDKSNAGGIDDRGLEFQKDYCIDISHLRLE